MAKLKNCTLLKHGPLMAAKNDNTVIITTNLRIPVQRMGLI